jgi:hypothetical protein
MRVQEVIRNILDVLDALDKYDREQDEADAANRVVDSPEDTEAHTRLNQIADLIDDTEGEFSNSSNPQYAGIDAVTASGTDVNKSKHPSDIRTNAASMYPTYQHKQGE